MAIVRHAAQGQIVDIEIGRRPPRGFRFIGLAHFRQKRGGDPGAKRAPRPIEVTRAEFVALRWAILTLGASSILSGWAYACGPAPISNAPLDELFVLAIFVLGGVGGPFWLAVGALAPEPLLAGLAFGLFAAGVLMVNNVRDAAVDARVGCRTLAIVAGPRAARTLFAALMAAPFVLLGAMVALAPRRALWLALGAGPLAWAQVKRLYAEPPGAQLNLVLARTARTQALYAVLLGLGALA